MEGNFKRNETVSPIAGRTPSQEMLVDVIRLEREYLERLPDVEDPTQLVSFGTSGQRGLSLRGSFNGAHILAITQAICDLRRIQGFCQRFGAPGSEWRRRDGRQGHLDALVSEAQEIVNDALKFFASAYQPREAR